MTTFEPSNYQKAILDAVRNTRDNLLVDAKAGSGKTSTLILIANEITKQNKKCLFLAFNKSIITELQNKISLDNCEIKTLHSLGLSFLRSYLYRIYKEKYELEIDENGELVKTWVEELFNVHCLDNFLKCEYIKDLDDSEIKDIKSNLLREIASMVNYVRLYNINYHNYINVLNLGNQLCWYLKFSNKYNILDYPKIVELIIDKIKYLFEHPQTNSSGIPHYIVSYTDMIYFPCLYKMFPPFSVKPYLDFILCDECQDLSVLQQLFLKLLYTNTNRFIFVGDEKQAIYGFAGADTKSIKNLKNNFYLKELPLNICYRCPENIIKLAKDIVPSIDWNHDRKDKGIIKLCTITDLKNNIKPGDVIIGRRNNDLLKLYKYLTLDNLISVKFKNVDMVNNIINEIKRTIKEYIKRYNQCLNVEKQLAKKCLEREIDIKTPLKQLSKEDLKFMEQTYNKLVTAKRKTVRNIVKKNHTISYLKTCMQEYKNNGEYEYVIPESVNYIYADYFNIIEMLLNSYMKINKTGSVNQFIDYLSKLLKGNLQKDVPILSSIHMMKGGEANNVFIIDYPRFPYITSNQPEDVQQQEINLQYVAITRAKSNLYLCKIEKPQPRETKEDIIKLNENCKTKIDLLLNGKII